MSDEVKLLVVDDDRMMLDFAMRVLASLGYVCVTASDAATTLRVLKEDPQVRGVIVDLRLGPAQDGAALVREALRLRPDIGGLLTSGDHEALQTAARDLGPDVAVLTKPYRRRDLADRLARVL